MEDGALLSSDARLRRNSLTLPVLKANRVRTARPLREEPFSARNWRGKNKAGDTGVASTSSVNTNLLKSSGHRFQ